MPIGVLRAQLKLEPALEFTERFAAGEYVPALLARAAVLMELGRESPIGQRAAPYFNDRSPLGVRLAEKRD